MTKLFRLPLYILILACTLWAVIFFGGAAAITYITKSYFNEKVKLHRVQVTPNLDIKIGRVEFDFPNHGVVNALTGHALAVDLGWSILNTNPSLNLNVGSIKIANEGALENTSFNLFFNNWSDFLIPEYFVNSNSINFPNLFAINTLQVQGKLNLGKGIVTDSLATLNNFALGRSDLLNTKKFVGSIETYDLMVPIEDQEFSIEIETDYASINRIPINFSGLLGEIKYDHGELNFGAEIKKITFKSKRVNVERVLFELNYSDLSYFDLIYNFEKVWAPETNLNISNGGGTLKVEDTGAELQLAGEIESVDLKASGQFITEIQDGKFSATAVTTPSLEGFKVGSLGSINLTSNSTPMFEFELKTQVPNVMSPVQCFYSPCALNEVDLDYMMNVADEKLYGRYNCPIEECLYGSGNHDFETVNTVKFFKALGDANIFNPFYVALAYSQIIQGDRTENGHKLSLR